MLNLISLEYIRVLRSKDDYELVSLGFKNHTLFYITYDNKPIYKYKNFNCALKRYFSLVSSYGGSL